ncbi:MAG: hypothetical protein Q9206_007402, partial [Seirophora lacunosa]
IRSEDGKEEGRKGVWHWLYKNFLERKPQEPPPLGPLVKPGLYRSYGIDINRPFGIFCRAYTKRVGDIYRLLQVIPSHDPTEQQQQQQQPTTSPSSSSPSTQPTKSPPPPVLRPHFHVYKSTPAFRKSAPGPPDFHICVLNARQDAFPSVAQLDALLQSVPYAPPPESEGRSYHRLRHGYRNVVLAVVDQGVVSYMRVADAGFGREKMYERVGRAGGKGKRGGAGAGRGRGRGRGGGDRGRGRGR